MDFELSPKHLEFQKKVRAFCREELAPKAAGFEASETFPWELIPGLSRLGLTGILFPKRYGGLEADMVSTCLALEEIGWADSSVALTVESHNGLCSNHIFTAGSEAQREKYLPRLLKGEELGAWALTEPGAGSDAAGIRAIAIKKGKNWVLNGSKTFTTQGSVAGVYVIFAHTAQPSSARTISAFIVEKGTPGLEVGKHEKKMGLRASDTVQLNLKDLTIPEGNLCGTQGRGFRDAMKVLDGGRVAISGISVGMAQRVLDEGISHVKARKHEFLNGGSPGLRYAQRLLADLATDIRAARHLMFHAASLHDQGRPHALEGSMSKLFSGKLVTRACTEVLDLLGMDGAIFGHPVERHFRAAKLYEIGEGSNQIQQLVISRLLLK